MIVAVAIGAVILILTGYDPLSVYRLMIEEAFGSERRIAATLTAATPLLLMGLAAAVAFRAGVFNVGAEGCFYLGGIAAAVARLRLTSWPTPMLVPFALAAAVWSAALWLVRARPPARPARRRRGRDDADAELHRDRLDELARRRPPAGARLGQFRNSADRRRRATAPSSPADALHLGFLISLALVAGYGVWSRLSVEGFRSRLVGLNPPFSRAVGIEVGRRCFSA